MSSSADPEHPAVHGSERKPLPGAELVRPVDRDEQLTITVLLRRRAELPRVDDSPRRVERSEFADSYGADPADVVKVEDFARENSLDVGDVNIAARTVSLSGSASAFVEAFGVKLGHYKRGELEYRGREGEVHVPADLQAIVTGVFGLDDRPQARPHFRTSHQAPAVGQPKAFTPKQVGELYGFGSEASGEGECIALVELGGGYQDEDLKQFFEGLGIEEGPTVVSVPVGEGKNDFAEGGNANVEVALDIEVAGALAPAATIAVYFAPNSNQGFLAAINEAVHDAVHKPSIISISWGEPEENWTPQGRSAMDEAFADAAALGISVFVAAGDHGSADSPQLEENGTPDPQYDGKAHVDFPASSPHVTACGGTHLEGEGGRISEEIVWNDGDGWAGGGGVSDRFTTVPAWQSSAGIPKSVSGTGEGRGVPDVAGNADNVPGYGIVCGGREMPVGGTSAVAPLWAGIIARLNQLSGRQVGFLNPALYTPAGNACLRDITEGGNAIAAANGQPGTPGYDAQEGWDACTGLGTPEAQALRALFSASGQTTTTQTPTTTATDA
jgi:kumamolisin